MKANTYRGEMLRNLAICVAGITSAFIEIRRVDSAVVSTSGSIEFRSPPISVARDQLESDSAIQLFAERNNFPLPSALDVDVTMSGFVEDATDLTPGTIAASTLVNSFFLHADPNGRPNLVTFFYGTVTFDTPILGVIVTNAQLNTSDAIVGSLSTSYSPDMFRGFDGPSFSASTLAVSDSVEVSPDFRTATVIFRSASFQDQIRIVTASVPEPATVMICLVGLIAGLTHRFSQ